MQLSGSTELAGQPRIPHLERCGDTGRKSLSPHHRAEGGVKPDGRHSSAATPTRGRPSTGHVEEKSALHLHFGALEKSKVRRPGQVILGNHWESARSTTSQVHRGLPAGLGLETCSPGRKELIISHQPTSPTPVTTNLLGRRKETTSTK